jgi:acylphosphatase
MTISGLVQGVMYRAFVRARARELGLVGWVRNLDTGEVEVLAEGEQLKIEQLLASCRTGPPHSRVTDVQIEWLPATGEFRGFRITW